VKQVLQRLEQYGIRARKSKCALCAWQWSIGAQGRFKGLHTLESKVTESLMINNMQLHSFLGPVQSVLTKPFDPTLNNLLKQGSKWVRTRV